MRTIVAFYGTNCAIYEPFDDGRFQEYQEGIKLLKSQVERAGAKFVLSAKIEMRLYAK